MWNVNVSYRLQVRMARYHAFQPDSKLGHILLPIYFPEVTTRRNDGTSTAHTLIIILRYHRSRQPPRNATGTSPPPLQLLPRPVTKQSRYRKIFFRFRRARIHHFFYRIQLPERIDG